MDARTDEQAVAQTVAQTVSQRRRAADRGAPADLRLLVRPRAVTGTATGADGGLRPEIQGLRAVAVGLVVLFHLWPNRLPGGYVGVDVFFVISGFLITGHLVREASTVGLHPLAFWARRIRRLLPASLLVLAVSGAASFLLVPQTLWSAVARQLTASALYVQNWALASDSVDYLARGAEPTVAQHYWSLSVEEQLYLGWPLLLLLAVRWGRRRGHGVARSSTVALAAVAFVSLAWSVRSTAADAPVAYLSTLTRAWEFATGGLVALLVTTRTPPRAARVLGWLGLGLVVASAVAYDARTSFPGWLAALPVAGTALVIAAGGPAGRTGAAHWLSARPLTALGDVSYSVYLVHWPLVVLVPYATGVPLRTTDKLAVGAATIALAVASKRWVEDPLRRAPVLAVAPWRAVAFAVVGSLVVVGGAQGVVGVQRYRAAAAAARDDDAVAALLATAVFPDTGRPAREPVLTGCTGPAALREAAACAGGPHGLRPLSAPATIVPESTAPLVVDCMQTLEGADVVTCDFGDRRRARRVVAVVGDSHAVALAPAARVWGEHGWAATVLSKASCPLSTTDGRPDPDPTTTRLASCRVWREEVVRRLVADRAVTDVFVTAFSSTYRWLPRPGRTPQQSAVDGYAEVFARLVAAGKTVHVVRDVPVVRHDVTVPTCLVHFRVAAGDCDKPRSDALPPDPAVEAARRTPGAVDVVDLTDLFCDRTTCYSQIGGLVAYRDRSHLSFEYAALLAPFIAARARLSPTAGAAGGPAGTS